MKSRSLKNQILLSYAIVIAVLSVCMFGVGYSVVKVDIFERIQSQVEMSLDSAHTFYHEDIRRIGTALEIADLNQDEATLRDKMRLHYFSRLSAQKAADHPSEIVRQLIAKGEAAGGTRVIGPVELATMDGPILNRVKLTIVSTPTHAEGGYHIYDTYTNGRIASQAALQY